jgi:hypothetical protein
MGLKIAMQGYLKPLNASLHSRVSSLIAAKDQTVSDFVPSYLRSDDRASREIKGPSLLQIKKGKDPNLGFNLQQRSMPIDDNLDSLERLASSSS